MISVLTSVSFERLLARECEQMLGEIGARDAASSIIRVMAASCGSPLTAPARISMVP